MAGRSAAHTKSWKPVRPRPFVASGCGGRFWYCGNLYPLSGGGAIRTGDAYGVTGTIWKTNEEKQTGRFEETRRARRYLFLASKLSHATQFVSLKESSSWSNASVRPPCWPSRSSPWPPRVPKPVCSAAAVTPTAVSRPAALPRTAANPAAVRRKAAASRVAVRRKAAASRAAAASQLPAASAALACSTGSAACSSVIAATTAALRLAASRAAALRAAAATKQNDCETRKRIDLLCERNGSSVQLRSRFLF